MKKWWGACFLFTLISTTAMAWPRVGDDARYRLTTTGGLRPIVGSAELTVTGINPSKNEIQLRMSAVMGSYSQSQNVTDKLSTAEQVAKQVAALVTHCQANGGRPVQLATPAGSFATCKISDDQGQKVVTTWYANVVFGYAKQVILVRAAGVQQTKLLDAFTNGNGPAN